MFDPNQEYDPTDGSEDYDYNCHSCLGTGNGLTPGSSCTACKGQGYIDQAPGRDGR